MPPEKETGWESEFPFLEMLLRTCTYKTRMAILPYVSPVPDTVQGLHNYLLSVGMNKQDGKTPGKVASCQNWSQDNVKINIFKIRCRCCLSTDLGGEYFPTFC